MANKKIKKIPVDKRKVMEILTHRGHSIRSLGHPISGVGWSEKTIRRGLNSGFMSSGLLHDIAKHIDVDPNELSDASDLRNNAEWENVGNRLHTMSLGYLRQQLYELVSFEQSDSAFEVLRELFGEEKSK